MKTTIEIEKDLLRRAKQRARTDGRTLRALVEEGLRLVLSRRRARKPYRLPDASVGGEGLTPEFRDASWEQIRDAIYEGRGS